MSFVDTLRQPAVIHRLFKIGILVKGIHAVIELVGAALIYIVSGTTLYNIVTSITREELFEDPNDFLANFLLQNAPGIAGPGKDFAALYLFVGALVNGILVIGLLARKRSAFPAALCILSLFVLYQLYLFAHTFSPWLLVFSAFDCAVIWLIAVEHDRTREISGISSGGRSERLPSGSGPRPMQR